MIKLVTDENFTGDILRGLLRRLPDLDVVRVQDTELAGEADPAILAWAAGNQRILLTHDRDTMPRCGFDRVHNGEVMPGIFLVSDHISTGQAIEEIILALHCLAPEECQNQVIYFPL